MLVVDSVLHLKSGKLHNLSSLKTWLVINNSELKFRLALAHELPVTELVEGDVPGRCLGRQLRVAGLHHPPLRLYGLAGAE